MHRTWFWRITTLTLVLLSISACAPAPAGLPTAVNATATPQTQPIHPTAVHNSASSPAPSAVSPTSAATAPALKSGKSDPTSLALSADGRTLAFGTAQGIYAYDAASQKQLWFKAMANNPAALAFSPDSSRLFVGSAYPYGSAVKNLSVLSGSTGDVLVQINADGDAQGSWSPDGKKLLTSGDCQEVEVREALTAKLIHTLLGAQCNTTDPGYAYAFWSWDGARIFVLQGSRISSWDASTYNPQAGFTPDLPPYATGLSYVVLQSPTEDLLALENGANIAVLDEKTGKTLRLLAGTQTGFPVGNMAWSPDGKRLAAGFADGQFVWDANTGQQIAHLKDYPTPFYSDSIVAPTLAWLPDNHTLVGLISTSGALNAVDLDTSKISFSLSGWSNP